MKPSFLRIFQEVNTEDGRGILVDIETPHNGLYVEFDRARQPFGMEHIKRWNLVE
jgi:hypothetical protein